VALLGKIIKGAVHLGYNLVSEVSDPVAAQQDILKELLTKAANTAFGEHYRFDEILASEILHAGFCQPGTYSRVS
jgi:hypothetical protein